MLHSKSLLLILLLAFLAINVHAINDMQVLAQLTGEHNGSCFGWTIITLDYNHDGYDDLVVLAAGYGYQYQQTPSRGKVYIYYGGPNFSSTTEPAITLEGDYPEGMQRKIGWIINIGDVDGDGFDDLMLTDLMPDVSNSSRLLFFFGQTDDLSTPDMVVIPLPNEDYYRFDRLGDVDGDGFEDLGISYSQNYIKKFDILWGGSFERQEVLTGVGSISYVSSIIGIGDIDNDGFDDFSIGYLTQEQDSYFSTISIYHGNSQRVFTDSTLLTHTSNSITRLCKPLGDLNGDGYDDFFGYADYSGMNIWYGASTSLSENPNVVLNPVYCGDSFVFGIESGDLNGDGYNDVVGASYGQRRFAVWLGNTSMNGHADWQKTNSLENYGYDLAVGDFNGDGYDDIAVSAPFEEGIWPYHDYRGYVFIYAGNAGMVANDDPQTPALAEQLSIRISPNPVRSSDNIKIEIKTDQPCKGQPVSIQIFNMRGQMIYQSDSINTANDKYITIPQIGDFPTGIYICKTTVGKMKSTKKFTIMK